MPPSQPSERDRAVLQFEPQVQLGKYPILREIGRGATSHVYLARDPFADREVAIKVFLFDQNADPQTERIALNLKWILANCAITPRAAAKPEM